MSIQQGTSSATQPLGGNTGGMFWSDSSLPSRAANRTPRCSCCVGQGVLKAGCQSPRRPQTGPGSTEQRQWGGGWTRRGFWAPASATHYLACPRCLKLASPSISRTDGRHTASSPVQSRQNHAESERNVQTGDFTLESPCREGTGLGTTNSRPGSVHGPRWGVWLVAEGPKSELQIRRVG